MVPRQRSDSACQPPIAISPLEPECRLDSNYFLLVALGYAVLTASVCAYEAHHIRASAPDVITVFAIFLFVLPVLPSRNGDLRMPAFRRSQEPTG